MYQDLPEISLVVETRCKSQFTHYCTNEYVLERSTKVMLKNINTKEENKKMMKLLGVSEEKARDIFVLAKAFKAQNRVEQERLCKKYNLPQGRTYGCWRYANSFGDFLAKLFAKGEFIPLEEIGNYEKLGVFKKCPNKSKM